MVVSEHTRRQVLRGSGALAAVVGAGGVAGCSQVPFVGGGGSTPDYAAWLTAPDELESDPDHYEFRRLEPAAMLEFEDAMADTLVETLDAEVPIEGLDRYGDLTEYVYLTDAVLFAGDFDRADVADELDAAGYEEDTVVDRTLYRTEGHAVAVTDERLVTSGRLAPIEDPVDAVETALETTDGSVERYQDDHEPVGELLSTLGDAHVVVGSGHDDDEEGLEAAVASGSAATVDGEETEIRAAVVFEEDEADDDDVEDWAEESDAFFGGDVETTTDGRTVVASTTVETSAVTSIPAIVPEASATEAEPEPSPVASFSFEYAETTDGRGVLRVSHDGGDTIPDGTLYLRGSGFADVPDVDQTEAGTWQGTTSGDDDAVVSGDFVEVGVRSDYELAVVYESPDGQRSATLQEDAGPDA
jgi:hypothetical protein